MAVASQGWEQVSPPRRYHRESSATATAYARPSLLSLFNRVVVNRAETVPKVSLEEEANFPRLAADSEGRHVAPAGDALRLRQCAVPALSNGQ